MVKELLNGQMESFIKEVIRMIKNKELEYFNGQIAENIQEIGIKVNNMGQEFKFQKMEIKNLENGMMGKGLGS